MNYVLSDGILKIVGRAGAVVELPGDSLHWDAPFEDAETGELVHLATIVSEEFQGLPDELIVLKLTETEGGGVQGGEVVVDRNDGHYEIDTEDLIVTIEDELDVGDPDD